MIKTYAWILPVWVREYDTGFEREPKSKSRNTVPAPGTYQWKLSAAFQQLWMVPRLYSTSAQQKVRSVFPPEAQDGTLVALIVTTTIAVVEEVEAEVEAEAALILMVVQKACVDAFVDVKTRKPIYLGVPSKHCGSHQSVQEARTKEGRCHELQCTKEEFDSFTASFSTPSAML